MSYLDMAKGLLIDIVKCYVTHCACEMNAAIVIALEQKFKRSLNMCSCHCSY